MTLFLRRHKLLLSTVIFLSIAVSALIVSVAFILQKVVDSALTQDGNAFQETVLLTVIFLIVFGLIYYFYFYFSAMLVKRVSVTIRQYIIDGLIQKNLQQYNEHNSSHYLSTLTHDVKQVEDQYLKPLINIVQSCVMFILSLAALIYLNTLVTLVLLACVVVMFIVPTLLSSVLERKQDALSKRMGKFTNHLKDFLEGFDVLYSFKVLKHARAHFRQENEDTAATRFAADKVAALNNSLSNVLGIIAQFAVILLAGYLILQGNLTGGALVALIQLSGSIVAPVVSIFSEMPKIKSVKSIVDRMLELGKDENKGQQKNEIVISKQTPKALQLKDLSFQYDAEQNRVIDSVNFEIELGKKYAIVGESGCGKSTLVKLVTGQLAPTNGEILSDEAHIMNADELIHISSIVSQQVFLFDDTVRHNIGLYEPFTDESFDKVVIDSGMYKFLSNKERGLDEMVGEGGSNFSGGQKQRIAIARALIRQKPILVLDEGTSALDVQTSFEIEQHVLEQPELTVLTITHQINELLLKKYDGIIYMSKGKIVEFGTYDELIDKQGLFKTFTTVSTNSVASIIV